MLHCSIWLAAPPISCGGPGAAAKLLCDKLLRDKLHTPIPPRYADTLCAARSGP